MHHHLSDIKIPNEFKSLLGQYDVVITMPIYTHLLFTQITSILRDLEIRKHMSSGYTQNIQEKVLEFMPKLIRSYNSLLQSLCSKAGLIIGFSDLIEVSLEHEIMIKIKGILWNDDEMNTFLSEYISKYGYGLGTYGMMHLKESMHVMGQHYLIWSFTKTRELHVGGLLAIRNFEATEMSP